MPRLPHSAWVLACLAACTPLRSLHEQRERANVAEDDASTAPATSFVPDAEPDASPGSPSSAPSVAVLPAEAANERAPTGMAPTGMAPTEPSPPETTTLPPAGPRFPAAPTTPAEPDEPRGMHGGRGMHDMRSDEPHGMGRPRERRVRFPW